MKNWKRICALLLTLVLLAGFVPTGTVQAQAATQELTEAAYASADLVFEKIDAMEAAPAKKNATQDAKTEAAIQIVTASEGYVEGSLERNGNAFSVNMENGTYRAYGANGEFLMLAKVEDGIMTTIKSFFEV